MRERVTDELEASLGQGALEPRRGCQRWALKLNQGLP